MKSRTHPTSLPRSLVVGVVGQFVGYCLFCLVQHIPQPLAQVSSAWFLADSAYRTWVTNLALVQWLLLRPGLVSWLLRGSFAIFCISYVFSLVVIRRYSIAIRTRALLIGVLVFSVPCLLTPQLFAADVYIYGMFGRIELLHGGNPYINVPADFPSDPFVPLVVATDVTSIYGPVWTFVALALTAIAELLHGSVWVYLLLFKLFALACHLINTVIIVRLLPTLRPQAVAWGGLLYAWHPLAIFEFIATGHNDVWMLTLILLALACAMRRWHTRALALLILAGMVKLVALLLVPLYALYVVHQYRAGRMGILVRQTILGMGIVVALYTPFWEGSETLDFGTAAVPLSRPYAGPASWVIDKFVLRDCVTIASSAPSMDAVKRAQPAIVVDETCRTRIIESVSRVSLLLFACAYVLLVFWPIHTLDAWIDRAVWVFLAYMLLAAIHFGPWYGTWMLALIPFMRQPRHLLWIGACTLLLLYGEVPIKGRTPVAFAPLFVLVLWELWMLVRPWIRPPPTRNPC